MLTKYQLTADLHSPTGVLRLTHACTIAPESTVYIAARSVHPLSLTFSRRSMLALARRSGHVSAHLRWGALLAERGIHVILNLYLRTKDRARPSNAGRPRLGSNEEYLGDEIGSVLFD